MITFALDKAMNDLYNASQAMQNYAQDAVVQERYRAALRVYSENLKMQQELAHEFLKQHKEINEKIFQDALRYIDVALEFANPRLAESALKLIETMRAKEPEFFNQYYRIRFGK